MAISSSTIALLMSKGIAGADLVEIVRALEADFRAAYPAPMGLDNAAERRRKWDRDRKRKLRLSGGNPVDIPPDVPVDIPVDASHTRVVILPLPSLRSEEGTSEDLSSSVVAPKPKSGGKRGTRLQDEWEPSPEDFTYAADLGLTTEETENAAREFRNFWLSRSRDACRLRWDLTWQNRVAELAQRKRERGQKLADRTGFGSGGGRGPSSFADIRARRRAESAG